MQIFTKKTLRTLPEIFSMYSGGLYIGNFFPGPPNTISGSDLYGNLNTGDPSVYKSETNANGNKQDAWAIILATEDYAPPPEYKAFRTYLDQLKTYKTSNHDGFFNLNEQISKFSNYIKLNIKYGIYGDWYVPSINELSFIAKNLPIGYYIPNSFESMNPANYRSSTFGIQNRSLNARLLENDKEVKTNHSFFYTQSFDKTKYGKVSFVSDLSTVFNLRLIRRVPLTILEN
jgi:hypothetical protein